MQKLDWSALIRPVPEVTRQRQQVGTVPTTEATSGDKQAVEYKGNNSVCPHVPTVPTEKEKVGGGEAHEVCNPLNTNDNGVRNVLSDVHHAPVGVESVGTARATHMSYALNDERHSRGLVIGTPGDTMADLLRELVERYGSRLDLDSVREAFEERSAIMQFDAGLSREDAERAARADVAEVVKRSKFSGAPL